MKPFFCIGHATLKAGVREIETAGRRREWISNESKRRQKRLSGEINEIAEELARRGVYPSANRIRELPAGHMAGLKVLNDGIREAQKPSESEGAPY